MHAHHDERRMRPQMALLIAGSLGLVAGVLALLLVALPTGKFLPQVALYSSIEQLSILVKLLSPLLCFLLVSGWAWVLLWIGESLLISHRRKLARSRSPQERGRQRYADHLSDPGSLPPASQTHTGRVLAVPPLFQLDPTDPSALTRLGPLPALPADWLARAQGAIDGEETDEWQSQEPETRWVQAHANRLPREQMRMEVGLGKPEDGARLPVAASPGPSLSNAAGARQPPAPIALSLLKQVKVHLLAPDGSATEVRLRWGERAIRLLLLAYLASKRGVPVDRDKLLEHVLARGRRKEYTVEQLGEVFDGIKKFLREDLKKAVHELNRAAGREVIAPTVDFFSTEPAGFYLLHPSCRVQDLDTIEAYYQVIQQARKDGVLVEKLDGSLPPQVIDTCEHLLNAYPGDFLEDLLSKFPEEFGAWVRQPFTHYRDYYLDALWILATHQSALGRSFSDDCLPPEQHAEQRRHYQSQAAQSYVDYAMYAIKSRMDSKLKFAYRAGKDGERVIMSARAMRRAVVLLGQTGKTDLIDQHYLAYKEKMHSLSEGQWKPDQATEEDVATAKKQTSAYRFSAQIPASQEQKQA